MADTRTRKLSAKIGKNDMQIGFCRRDGGGVGEARYLLFDGMWLGKQPDAGIVGKDTCALWVYTKNVPAEKVVWRTLFPGWDPAWDALSPEEADAKLEGLVCHQKELYVLPPGEGEPKSGEPRTRISSPLGLCAHAVDLDMKLYGQGEDGEGIESQVLYAHPRGRLQVEARVGKDAIRHSIPIWAPLRVLNVEIFVLAEKGADGKPKPYFDPTKGLDREWFLQSMNICTDVYANVGVDFNTWLPESTPGFFSVSERGRTYHGRFITSPDKDKITHPDDTPGMLEKMRKDGRGHRSGEPGVNISEYDRAIFYPRAFPGRNPNAVRVFFASQYDYGSKGVAIPETYKDKKTEAGLAGDRDNHIIGLTQTPSIKSCFVLHGRKPGPMPTLPPTPANLEETYHADIYTTAHEVGHIMGPNPNVHFYAGDSRAQLHLMADGKTGDTTDWERVFHGTYRVFQEKALRGSTEVLGYDYPTKIYARTFLSPPGQGD